MRYITSVWNFLVRRSFWRVMLILLLLVGANVLCFFYYETENRYYAVWPLDSNAFRTVLFLGFTAMLAVLPIPGCSFSTCNGYTLRRLGISERAVFFLQAAFNAACFALLGLTQLLCLCAFEWVVNGLPADAADYTRYYYAGLFHSLLPLRDGWRWTRNIALVIGLGLSTAAGPFHQRRGKFAASLVLMFLITIFLFCHDITDDWVFFLGWPLDVIATGYVAFVASGVLICLFCEVPE